VNQCSTLLGYVIKQKSHMHNNGSNSKELLNLDIEFYEAYIIEFKTEVAKIHTLEKNKLKQVRIQFLYKEKSLQTLDKLLVLVHQECKLH
jgi:hypothetical protein